VKCQSKAANAQCQQVVGMEVETYYLSDKEGRRWAEREVETEGLIRPQIQTTHPSRSSLEVDASSRREYLAQAGGYKTAHPPHHRCRVCPPGKEEFFPG